MLLFCTSCTLFKNKENAISYRPNTLILHFLHTYLKFWLLYLYFNECTSSTVKSKDLFCTSCTFFRNYDLYYKIHYLCTSFTLFLKVQTTLFWFSYPPFWIYDIIHMFFRSMTNIYCNFWYFLYFSHILFSFQIVLNKCKISVLYFLG